MTRDGRAAWEAELKELPALLARLRRELQATHEVTPEDRDRREALMWNIRRVEHRITDLRSRLNENDGGAEGEHEER